MILISSKEKLWHYWKIILINNRLFIVLSLKEYKKSSYYQKQICSPSLGKWTPKCLVQLDIIKSSSIMSTNKHIAQITKSMSNTPSFWWGKRCNPEAKNHKHWLKPIQRIKPISHSRNSKNSVSLSFNSKKTLQESFMIWCFIAQEPEVRTIMSTRNCS